MPFVMYMTLLTNNAVKNYAKIHVFSEAKQARIKVYIPSLTPAWLTNNDFTFLPEFKRPRSPRRHQTVMYRTL